MAEFGSAVGNGIASLVGGAFDVIGATLRGMFTTLNNALPGGLLFLVAFVVLVAIAWNFAKR